LEKLNASEIVFCLDRLNIKREPSPNHKNWLGILCPNHTDTNFGSCSINLSNGVISCFACGYKKHITKFISDKFQISYKEAVEYVKGIKTDLKNNPDLKIEVEVEKPKELKTIKLESLLLQEFNPEDYIYTKSRGFTKEFCKEFEIKHCLSKVYKDYFITPIKSKKLNVNTFEARKLRQKEHLAEYYNSGYSNELELRFDNYIDRSRIRLKKNKLLKNGVPFYDEDIYYQLRTKVLYPINSNVCDTLFNYDNLEKNKILFLVEGIGSISKIWSNVSKNVTCFFGVKLSFKQLELLKEFETIYHIPDFDEAGYNSVVLLNSELTKNNYNVIDTRVEDTSEYYVSEIKNRKNIIKPSEYLLKYFQNFNTNRL